VAGKGKSGELDSTWLRWNAQRAGAFSFWVPPSVGEQVWFLCLGGNTTAAIIGEVFTATTIRRQVYRQKK
jgi:phage baseplate assembly protein V